MKNSLPPGPFCGFSRRKKFGGFLFDEITIWSDRCFQLFENDCGVKLMHVSVQQIDLGGSDQPNTFKDC